MNHAAPVKSLEAALLADVFLVLTDEPQSPERVRSAIRGIFAAIEGSLFAMKQRFAESAAHTLTPGELAVLREERYTIGGNGQVESASLPIRFEDNIRFAIAIIRKLHPEARVKLDGSGWQALKKAVKIRHRLTHPKSVDDLDVSADELTCALDGLLWFLSLSEEGERALRSVVATPEAKQLRLAKALRDYVPKPETPQQGST
jgi:hypothetical protein